MDVGAQLQGNHHGLRSPMSITSHIAHALQVSSFDPGVELGVGLLLAASGRGRFWDHVCVHDWPFASTHHMPADTCAVNSLWGDVH